MLSQFVCRTRRMSTTRTVSWTWWIPWRMMSSCPPVTIRDSRNILHHTRVTFHQQGYDKFKKEISEHFLFLFSSSQIFLAAASVTLLSLRMTLLQQMCTRETSPLHITLQEAPISSWESLPPPAKTSSSVSPSPSPSSPSLSTPSTLSSVETLLTLETS